MRNSDYTFNEVYDLYDFTVRPMDERYYEIKIIEEDNKERLLIIQQK